MQTLYLDHNSTTPLSPAAAKAMAEVQAQHGANPASQHALGRRARQTLEDARDDVARLLGARTETHAADRVLFTSGGTEANNLALLGLARLLDPRSVPGEAIVSAIEHPSVDQPAKLLERHGWRVHRLKVTPDGVVDIDHLDALLSGATRFVSVMLANNETGVVQPVTEIAHRCAAKQVPLHVDAAQAVGKLPVDFRASGCSLMSVAAHKFQGPLGIGALVVRHGATLEPLLRGGPQQGELRAGTESVALAVGMRAALAECLNDLDRRTRHMQALRDLLERGLATCHAGQVVINGVRAPRLPNTTSVAFGGIDRQRLLMALDLAGVCCSTGSACASGSSEPSTVLAAMGVSAEVLAGSIRISLGATTTEAEVEEALARITAVCRQLAAKPAVARR
jgi:cysteine desulfurase